MAEVVLDGGEGEPRLAGAGHRLDDASVSVSPPVIQRFALPGVKREPIRARSVLYQVFGSFPRLGRCQAAHYEGVEGFDRYQPLATFEGFGDSVW